MGDGAGSGELRIDLAETAEFDLGGLRVNPARREVIKDGQRRELEPRVTQVLVALASARPGVVSRDRLVEQCWNGRIVGDDAITRCIVALRHLAKEFTPQPFTIETVPRVGYSLIERVDQGSTQSIGAIFSKPRLVAAAFLSVVLLFAALLFAWSHVARTKAAPASIAVLPFRNVSSGDPYFAEGIGEEILSQLAREPQFRVAGLASSAQFGKDPDIMRVARQLDVEYVLEGSVRKDGNRVRVHANLVRASDGAGLWADRYDGTLEDVFAIQQRIGGDIANALRRKLVGVPPLSGPLVTNGDAYNLYLTARGLIRTRNRRVGATAANLLRDAVKLDPGFAPAWASLASAVQLEASDHESLIAATKHARGYARHAIRLAPNLDEAHRVLGWALGFGTEESRAYLIHAAELGPNNAENTLGLGAAQGAVGEFEQELATYRRAAELDPVLFRTVGATAIALANLGNRGEAETVARRGFANDAVQQQILLGRIAFIFGDFSEAARHWSIVAGSNSQRWSNLAQRFVNDATFAVSLGTRPLLVVSRQYSQRNSWPVSMEFPPAPPVWQARNRDPVAADVYRDENHVAAKLMLNSGRASELAAGYAGEAGLLGLRPREAVRVDQLYETPVVALALREVGQGAEAERLLGQAEAGLRHVYRRSRVPFWFDADAAAIFAVAGRKEQALAMLERAIGRGWRHASSTDLRDLADEPAFRSLHHEPRFERIARTLKAHYARERRETEGLRLIARQR